MAVNLSPVGGVAAQFFDNSGNVLTGGKIYTYLAGTTTPAATYTSAAGITAWSNPIVLDASGRVSGSGEIWLTDSVQYKFLLKDSNDVLIATYDNITGINSNFVNFVSKEETQTATQGQTVFNLTTMEYQPGVNNLLVFVNGSKQIVTTNYVETDSGTVTFVDGLNVGDVVDFSTATPINTTTIDAGAVAFTGFKDQVGSVQDLADNDGSDWIGFIADGTGAVAESVQDKLRQTPSISVKDFGAVGDGVADDTLAIQAAFDYSNELSFEYSLLATGSNNNITDAFTRPEVFFPIGIYKITDTIVVDTYNVKIRGDRSVLTTVTNGVIDDKYLIKFTAGFNILVENMLFVATESGAVIFDAPNVSTAMVTFRNCDFMGNDNGGNGLYYLNQSSLLKIDNCRFIGLGQAFINPVTGVEGKAGADKVDINDCMFDVTFPADRAQYSGYIALAKGKVNIKDCLFVGGPAIDTSANQEIAFIDCNGDASLTDLTLENTRIAFEVGSATVINWRQPFNTAEATGGGSVWRGGFTMKDCIISPRGENIPFGDFTATPVVRLIQMPNRMWILNNTYMDGGGVGLGWLAPGASTTLDELYDVAAQYITQNATYEKYSKCSYRIENNVSALNGLIPTTTDLEYSKWLYLFNNFNFTFLNNSGDPNASYTELEIDTFYSGGFLEGGLFKVEGTFVHFQTGATFARSWLIRCVKTSASSGTYSFLVHNNDDAANVNGINMTVTPYFYDGASATTTVPYSADLNDYTLQLKFTPNTGAFSMYPIYIEPLNYNDMSTGTNGGLRQYRLAYN